MIGAIQRFLQHRAKARELDRINREIERGIAQRRAVREARAEAARQGQHTYWKRVGASTREIFG